MNGVCARCCAFTGALAIAPCVLAAETGLRVIDRFDDASAWTALASDQVTSALHSIDDGDCGKGLCLDFDFHGVSGYAAMRRRLPIDYPPNYEFTFRVRGAAPDNALQFKLADAGGDNVWWANRPDFTFPHDWAAQRYRKREIAFAWGPAADHSLRHSESVEFTIYAGKGGRGEVCFDRLALRELPPPPATWPRPVARASSALAGVAPANAVDANPATAWRSDPRRGPEQTLTLDLGLTREFGGVVLHWHADAFASRYDIELSEDGLAWRLARRVSAGNGGIDPLYLPESEARYLRIALHAGPQKSYALDEVEIRDLAFGASANAFFSGLAKEAPRGAYPRAFHDEQTYWTVVGIDGGHESGLLSEDGALEVARGGFSVEPFLIDETGRVISWADVTTEHTLQDGYLPLPSVRWSRDDLRLTTTVFGTGSRDRSQLIARYALTNTADRSRRIILALGVRPFQVNPSVQFLNTPGGVSPIHDLAFAGNAVSVDGTPRVFALATPDAFVANPFDAGMTPEQLRDLAPTFARSPRAERQLAVHDDVGLASGALLYRIELPPRATRAVALAIPLDGAAEIPATADTDAWLSAQQAATAAAWHRKLDGLVLRLPPQGRELANTLRSALADILLSRDGAQIRPGTRSYARSWIRDGTMISEALLRLGHIAAARDYLEWYAPYQFRSGKVPCCVDARGADPVAENDSHGELIHLVHEVWRYSGDRALLEHMWPHVAAAIGYMDRLRASERTAANHTPQRRALFGLMPASISHEGYSAKPMHSYWDDFWALTGYADAVDLARALGKTRGADRIARARDEFRGDLHASIRTAAAAHHIDYLPGSAELGDFDATSTTIGLAPAGEQANLPQDLLRNTYERYWNQFVERRDSTTWTDYTPYEWRNVGAFVRLGWRARAQAASDFFMRDRRPSGWNQWAEVVGRDPRESRFIGDMPHGWIASDFIRATLDRFVYERAADHALVLAAGVPSDWLDGDGIAIGNLHTPYGTLDYALRRVGKTLHLHLGGTDLRFPRGGFVLAAPGGDALTDARIDERGVRRLRITTLPADLVINATARGTTSP